MNFRFIRLKNILQKRCADLIIRQYLKRYFQKKQNSKDSCKIFVFQENQLKIQFLRYRKATDPNRVKLFKSNKGNKKNNIYAERRRRIDK